MLQCAPLSGTAFVLRSPTTRHTVGSSRISSELYGVRSALRKRFLKYRDSFTPSPGVVKGMTNIGSSPQVEQKQQMKLNPSEKVALLEDYNIDGANEAVAFAHLLPPREECEMTQYEKEFRAMMEEVESYTDRDVQSVADPKSRALFQGAREGAAAPEVYRAFEILFQDLVPVRVAGRMIFKKLSQQMKDSREHHQQQIDTVANSTGLSASEVESGRFAFLSIADYKNDGNTVLSVDQLVETGVAATVVEMLGYEDFDEFVANTCQDKRRELKFDEMMVALQQCPTGSRAAECNPHLVLQEIAKRINSTDAIEATDRKKKYAKRYDEMVKSFGEWEQYMPQGEGRWLDVLRGCFVGAKIDTVVEALKIVYIDYSALRLAGDSIFGIVSKLIRKRKS